MGIYFCWTHHTRAYVCVQCFLFDKIKDKIISYLSFFLMMMIDYHLFLFAFSKRENLLLVVAQANGRHSSRTCL